MHSLSLPASRHKGRTKSRKLFKPTGPDQLWETDITYIPIESGMTYLMCVKDCFSKEWQGYNHANSCIASDAIGSVEDAVMRTFDGDVPEGLVLRVDNGPQYQSGNFRRAMKLPGIKTEYIQKHTPEDNGNIESFHSAPGKLHDQTVEVCNRQLCIRPDSERHSIYSDGYAEAARMRNCRPYRKRMRCSTESSRRGSQMRCESMKAVISSKQMHVMRIFPRCFSNGMQRRPWRVTWETMPGLSQLWRALT